MKKKSIWGAIFINSALAVALAIYTIVAMVTTNKPKTTNIALALRVDDEYTFENGSITFEGLDGKMELIDGKYIAKSAGSFKCTVEKSDKSLIVYDVTIYDYGTGANDDPYNIVKAEHLFDLSKDLTEGDTIYDNLGAIYALRADIDLSGYNWVPIGNRVGSFNQQIDVENGKYTAKSIDDRYSLMFTGFIDGNGYSIKNLTINITRENFLDYARPHYSVIDGGNALSVNAVYLDVGFIGYAYGAIINGVTFDNANISIAADILDGTFAPDIENVGVVTLRTASNDLTGDAAFAITSGIVAGNLTSSYVGESSSNNMVSIVNSKLFSGNANGDDGIGLLAGSVRYSEIVNVKIEDSQLKANSVNTLAGGLIGLVYHLSNTSNGTEFVYSDLSSDNNEFSTKISNITMNNVSVIGNASSYSRTGGLFAEVYGATISNIIANNLNVSLDGKSANKNSTMIAGVAALLQSFKTENGTLQQASLMNVLINGSVNAKDSDGLKHSAAGVVYSVSKDSGLYDVNFAGSISGSQVGGLVVYNYGNIVYGNDYDYNVKAVDAKLDVLVGGAGIAQYNFGDIDVNDGMQVSVKVEINGERITTKVGLANALGLNGDSYDTNQLTEMFMMGGVASYSPGSVSGIAVEERFVNPINVGGVVGTLSTQRQNVNVYAFSLNENNKYQFGIPVNYTETSTVENVSSNIVVVSGLGAHPGTTKRAAGVVALVNSNSTISNVVSSGNINGYISNNADDSVQASGYLVAGLVAEINGESINLQNAETSMTLKSSTSAYHIENKYVSYVAGAVAFVEQTAGVAISITDVKVSANNGVIYNGLGSVNNNSNEFDSTSAGAYGLFGIINGISGTEVVVDNLQLFGYEIKGNIYASGGFGVTKHASISNVIVEASKVEGSTVAGMFAVAQNVEINNSGVRITSLQLSDNVVNDNTQHIAGFVALAKVDFRVSNCYAIVLNSINVGENDLSKVIASFAIEDASQAIASSYENVVIYVTALRGTTNASPIQTINGSSSSLTCINVKALNAAHYDEVSGITLLTADEMKNQEFFAGFDFDGNIWEIKENDVCPTLKSSFEE